MLRILIVDPRAVVIKDSLEKQFPEVSVTVAADEAEAMESVGQADVLSFFKVSDALMAKAANLKWVQALTTGTDYIFALPSLPRDVIVTSTRGIHGPQMSEMAILLMLALTAVCPRWYAIRTPDPGPLAGQTAVEQEGRPAGVGNLRRSHGAQMPGFRHGSTLRGHGQKGHPGSRLFSRAPGLHQVLALADYVVIWPPTRRKTIK